MKNPLFCRFLCLASIMALVACGTGPSNNDSLTPAQAVAAAKAALTIGYAVGDSASSVTQDLTLPTTGLHGSTVAWASSNPAAVTTAGVVTRPVTQEASVNLSATITVGTASDTKVFTNTVKPQMTDEQAVAAAKAALAIGYAPGDAATSVTSDVSLPLTGADSCSISWSSSDPSALTTGGGVSRPFTQDAPVTLTATITSNGVSDTKVFILTLKAQMTDAEAVAAAKAALQIGYASGDSATGVTQNVSLPLTGSSGTTVSWASDTPSVISTGGVVSRPAIGDAQLSLTATITSGAVSDTQTFTITVKGQLSDADAVAAAKQDLNITYGQGDSAISVTQNVGLASSGSNGCTVTWASDHSSLITTGGVVTRPSDTDTIVNLTATIASHGFTDTKQFALTVKLAMTDAAAVAADKAAISLGYGPGDSASHVTANITLPTSGTNGSTITWSSDTVSTITSSGGVTVPNDADVVVTMTATLTKGSATDTASFPLTVKALLLSTWIDSASISPGNGAIEVDPGIVIAIPFTRALDAATVDGTTFQLINTGTSQQVPVTVSYDGPSKTVDLTPQSSLAQTTQYSVVVTTGLKDFAETPLPSPMGFNFTTLSYANILSQWKFNGDGSDASGHGNVFALTSGSYDTAVVHEGSNSLYLDGAAEGGTSSISLGTQLTVSVWVNVDNPIQPSINTIMANADTGEATDGFKLCINRWNTSDQSVVIEVGDGTVGGKWLTAGGLIQPGNWYHLAFVIDQPNQVMKIYYNGAAVPLSFASDEGRLQADFRYDFNTAGPFMIGAFPGGYFGFKGHLDDMRVYNRVLSDEEIAKIAQEH